LVPRSGLWTPIIARHQIGSSGDRRRGKYYEWRFARLDLGTTFKPGPAARIE
jgi:hypothetical protein